jgi:hypothetical protein
VLRLAVFDPLPLRRLGHGVKQCGEEQRGQQQCKRDESDPPVPFSVMLERAQCAPNTQREDDDCDAEFNDEKRIAFVHTVKLVEREERHRRNQSGHGVPAQTQRSTRAVCRGLHREVSEAAPAPVGKRIPSSRGGKMPLTCPNVMNTFCSVIRNLNSRLLENALLLSSAAVGF